MFNTTLAAAPLAPAPQGSGSCAGHQPLQRGTGHFAVQLVGDLLDLLRRQPLQVVGYRPLQHVHRATRHVGAGASHQGGQYLPTASAHFPGRVVLDLLGECGQFLAVPFAFRLGEFLVQIRFRLRRFLRPVTQEGPRLPLQRLDDRKPCLDLVLIEDRFQRIVAVPLGRHVPVQPGKALRVTVGQDEGAAAGAVAGVVADVAVRQRAGGQPVCAVLHRLSGRGDDPALQPGMAADIELEATVAGIADAKYFASVAKNAVEKCTLALIAAQME